MEDEQIQMALRASLGQDPLPKKSKKRKKRELPVQNQSLETEEMDEERPKNYCCCISIVLLIILATIWGVSYYYDKINFK